MKSNNNMNRIRHMNFGIIAVFIALILPGLGYARSFHYWEQFPDNATAISHGWAYNFPMSRDMMVYDRWHDGTAYNADNHPGSVNVSTDGRLEIFGRPNNEALSWNNWYIGDGAKWDPSSCPDIGTDIHPTAEEPFGYTVIRYVTSIDPNDEVQGVGTEQRSFVTAWLASDTNNTGTYPAYWRYNNFVYFYEKGTASTTSTFGYFKDYEHDKAIAGLDADVDNKFAGLLENFFRRNYDDTSGAWINSTNYHFAGSSGYSNPTRDELGIKLTHDGDTITIYVNPDPLGNVANLSNTWIPIGVAPVGWYSNIVAFLGIEANYYCTEDVESQFDNFLVRTVASNIVASITPQAVVANNSVPFTVTLSQQNVATEDSGIGEVYIKKPSGYSVWNFANVTVTHPVAGSLTRITTGAPNASQFLISTNSDGLLHIRFQMTDQANNRIVRNGGVITVGFSLTTPTAANRDGDNFAVYGDCSQHNNTGVDYVVNTTTGIRYATTGMKKARPMSTDALLVKVYTQPDVYAKVECSPSPLTVGNPEADFTVKLATPISGNSPDISRFRIFIPSGFSVSNNTAGRTNIISSLLGAVNSYNSIHVSSNFIYIMYTNTSLGGLAGVNGYDKIQFTVYGTPSVNSGFYSNFLWQVRGSSVDLVAGSAWTNAKTNSQYSSQQVRVTVSNAQVLASVYPEKTAIFTTMASNVNYYEYTVRNVGYTGNDVHAIRVIVPGDYNSLTITSNLLGSASLTYSNQTMWIDYSGVLAAGQQDKIFFSAIHTNTNVFASARTVNFICYADNNNTGGFKLMMQDSPKTWGVTISPPVPYGQNYLSPRRIYTTAVTNYITNIIYNKASRGVYAKLVRIEMLTNWFPSIVSVASSHLNDQANLTNFLRGATNVILINYGDDGDDLASIYDNPGSPDSDTIIIKVVDAIRYNSFATFPTNVSIPTYIFKSAYETNASTFYALSAPYQSSFQSTNRLYVELPLLDVSFHVSPSLIDSTSNTTAMTYVFTNNGLPGNRIDTIYIPISTSISTNIQNITATLSSGRGFNQSQNRIEITYNPPLDGGQISVVNFDLVDIVDGRDATEYMNPDIHNDRGWSYNLATGSYTVNFAVPKPTGGGWSVPNVFFSTINEPAGSIITQQFTVNVTNLGTGTDQFKAISVLIPRPLRGHIGHVWSERLAANEMSVNIDLTTTNILLIYSNAAANILSRQGDKLTITAYISNVSSLPTNGNWEFLANNGFVAGAVRYFSLTNAITGRSARVSGTERVYVAVIGDSTTTELTNNFDYQITNGSAGSLTVNRVKIQVPWPYTVGTSDIVVTETSAAVSMSNNFIVLTYPGGGYLDAGERTVLKVTAVKPILSDETNVIWNAWVYYTNNVGFSISNNTKGDKIQSIVMPTANFYSYVTPNDVGKDNDYADITLTVTNLGELGNNLYRLKILPPTTNSDPKLVITNISGITSLIGGVASYSNDGCVYVNYSSVNTNIPSLNYDIITFSAYDNQANEGFSGNWRTFAGNLRNMNPIIESQDPIDIGASARYTIVIPEYNSSFYLTPNTVSTVELSNTLNVYVNNTGTGTNTINSVRVLLPYPFDLTGVAVSTRLSNTARTTGSINGTNYIEVTYLNNLFIPMSNDQITIHVRDNITFGNTNAGVKIYVKYNTSGSTYVIGVVSGGTNYVSYVMPNPTVSFQLMNSDIYTSQAGRDARVGFRYINTGNGSNTALRAFLTVPFQLTNGMVLGDMTDSLATNITFSSNTFVMNYAAFATKATNDIYLSFNSSVTSATSLYFGSQVYNGLRLTNVVATLANRTMNVVVAPSADLSNKTVYSTPFRNTVRMYVRNNTSGSSSVSYANIILPGVFTNVISATSLYGSMVSNFNTNLIIYYPSGLAKGIIDTVTLTLVDNKAMYITNGMKVLVEVNNGTGYGTARERNTGDLSMNMIIPLSESTNDLLTKWFLMKYSVTTTNHFSIIVSNTTAGENLIYSNKIVLPDFFDNRVISSTLVDTHSGSTITYVAPHTIIVEYSGPNYLGAGVANQIDFDFENDFSPKSDFVKVYFYNGSTLGAKLVSSPITIKNVSAANTAYVYDSQVLYSIDHVNTIRFEMQNGMYDNVIDEAVIGFDNQLLKITGLFSSNRNSQLIYGAHWTTNSSNLIVNYAPLGGISTRSDDDEGRESLMITVAYTNTYNWTNDMTTYLRFEDNEQYFDTSVVPGERMYVPVMLADFGRIRGYILPGFSSPSIRLYYTNTTTIVSNIGKGVLQLTADAISNGYFLLDYVPIGTFNLSFNGEDYFETVITNITITSNLVHNIGTRKMKRQYFLTAEGYQDSICLDDMVSTVKLSSGSLLPAQFSVNIWISNMTGEQATLASSGGVPIAPANGSEITVYYFALEEYLLDQNKNPTEIYDMVEEALKGDITVQLTYSDSDISAKGWTENNLAVYYWREMTKEWVRVGGVVDTENNTVTIQTTYLHRYYAVFGENPMTEIAPGFVSVVTDPKVFTPTAQDSAYNTMKLTVGFSEEVDSYTVKIYSLSGALVKEFVHSGETYMQGEIYWDGADSDGVAVKAGVYVYRIIAGGHTFAGTIILAR